MFREIRRKDREISQEEMCSVLNAASYGVLSMMEEDGMPYAVPINFVYKDGKVFFHTAVAGHKLENMEINNHVSFCVVTDVETIPDKFTTKYKSVVISGTVEEVDPDKKIEIFKLLLEKFSGDFMETGMEYVKRAGNSARIFQIDIVHMTGKGQI